MKIAPVPAFERERQKALNDYYILDTLPEGGFDDITAIASMVCDTPVALVSLIDMSRQWFKSHHGLDINETSRDHSFCAHAINTPDEVFIVNDLSKDERFLDNPFVIGEPHALFYAAIPLVNPEGHVLGTLCVMDHKPRALNDKQISALRSLGRQVVAQMELRRKSKQLRLKQADLNMAYADLEQIAFLASHDLKSPLNNIISLADLVKTEFGTVAGEECNEYLQYLSEAAYHLSDMVSGILSFSRAAKMATATKEAVNIEELVAEVKGLIDVPANTSVNFLNRSGTLLSCREALKQILFHLLKNAVEYGDKPWNEIDVKCSSDKNGYMLEVRDNGEGISEADKEHAVTLFKRLRGREKSGAHMGVGLAIVKRLVEKLSGQLSIRSVPGGGTAVIVFLPK